MAKLKTDAITQADLAQFATNDSDFAFELRVLRQLRELDFQCEHSGTYEDPVTGKFRQFDIRAKRHRGNGLLALAVECKNVRPCSPLLLSANPRTDVESFQDRIDRNIGGTLNWSTCTSLRDCDSAYPIGESVGKKTDQVGREDASNALVSDDSATFEKLNQAVNSCRDLVRHYGSANQPPLLRIIIPVLVVPNDVLWQVDYASDGRMAKPPRLVPATTLFLDRSWECTAEFGQVITYRISHLEIWTPAGLDGRADELSNLLSA